MANMFLTLKNIKPQYFFLYASILFFIAFNIVTPPLQAPDEFNHFYKAYQIAGGKFLPNKVDDRLGCEIPNSINKFVFPFDNAATEKRLTLTKEDVLNGFRIKYTKDTTQFKDFPNTSYYSPISYLPQAIAIFITKRLGCSVGTIYYSARLLTFLVWLICMFFVIKTVPVYKWLFTFICLLPMHLYVTNSFSADTMSNILSFLFIALILKHTFSAERFQIKDLLILILLVCLLALAKVVYTALVVSFLIIPFTKFSGKRQYITYIMALFFSAFAMALYWSNIVTSYYTPYVSYNPEHRDWICLTHNSNYYDQKAYILSHGTYFLKVIYHSLFNHPHTYLDGYIGVFGNSDIPLPDLLLWVSYAVLIFIALFEKNKFSLTISQKLVLVSASFASFVLLLLSQHLTWDAVGEGVVDVVQGRYLIPLFPFVLFAIGGFKLTINIPYRLILFTMLIVLYTFSVLRIRQRYYVGNCIEKTGFTCDAESVNYEGKFITSDVDVLLPEGNRKTDSLSHSGKSSLLLSPQAPYGFTHKFDNLHEGDLLEVSLWQKGQGAVLVITNDGDSCEKFYFPSSAVWYYDTNGWGRLYNKFLMTQACKNAKLAFYVWNPTKEKIWVDDLSFSIKRFAKK